MRIAWTQLSLVLSLQLIPELGVTEPHMCAGIMLVWLWHSLRQKLLDLNPNMASLRQNIELSQSSA